MTVRESVDLEVGVVATEIALTLHARDRDSDAQASVADIAPVVGQWVGAPDPQAVIETGAWELPSGDLFTTEKLDLGVGEEWAWIGHFKHVDQTDPTIHWVVEVKVVEAPDQANTEIGITLARESSDRRVRPLTTDEPVPPRVIRDLIDADRFECLDGDVVLWTTPRTLRREHVGDLVQAVLSPSRHLPVIGISISPETGGPIVSPDFLARKVAGMAHVWVIPPDVTWALSNELPDRLSVFNGAVRVWWPGLEVSADPFRHNLFQRHWVEVEDRVTRLVHRASTERFASPPGVDEARLELRRREEVALLDDLEKLASQGNGGAVDPEAVAALRDRIRDLQRDRDDALEEASALDESLRRVEAERDGLRVELERVRSEASADAGESGSAEDPTAAFLDEVRSTYRREVCPSDADRRTYPLLEVRLHPEFLASVDRLEGIDRSKIVRVCAEVACDRAREVPGRAVHAFRAGDGANAPQKRRRADNARAYRCALQRETPGARRLHWWRVPSSSGVTDAIELAWVGVHDDATFPE